MESKEKKISRLRLLLVRGSKRCKGLKDSQISLYGLEQRKIIDVFFTGTTEKCTNLNNRIQ
jgi:hypothetical protein